MGIKVGGNREWRRLIVSTPTKYPDVEFKNTEMAGACGKY